MKLENSSNSNLAALYCLPVIFLLVVGCSDSLSQEQRIAQNLLGKWLEISPCESCSTLTFSSNDTIYLSYEFDPTVYKIHYQIISDDSIKVTRMWDIEQSKKTTTNKVNFLEENGLFLEQFMAVDAGVTGFQNITLNKID